MSETVNSRHVERVYERLSSRYDLFFDHVFQPGRESALEALDLGSGERVLEVGVGTGLVLPLYGRDVEVIGIDLSEAMLVEARERIEKLRLHNVSVHRMDAAELQFDDATFDAVFAPYVISVVPDPGRVMREIARVCRPGGRIAVVNHFLSGNRVKAALEKALSPLSVHLGFHLNTPIETVLGTPGVRLVSRSPVNLLGNWTQLILEKPALSSRI